MTDVGRSPGRDGEELAQPARWDWDVASDRVTWSDDLYRLYGIEPREFRASFEAFIQRVHPDDRRRVELNIRQAMRDGKPIDFTHRLIRPEGSVRLLRCHAEVEFDSGRNVVRMWGTAEDITP
jgi:PAS domain-containing protein